MLRTLECEVPERKLPVCMLADQQTSVRVGLLIKYPDLVKALKDAGSTMIMIGTESVVKLCNMRNSG